MLQLDTSLVEIFDECVEFAKNEKTNKVITLFDLVVHCCLHESVQYAFRQSYLDYYKSDLYDTPLIADLSKVDKRDEILGLEFLLNLEEDTSLFSTRFDGSITNALLLINRHDFFNYLFIKKDRDELYKTLHSSTMTTYIVTPIHILLSCCRYGNDRIVSFFNRFNLNRYFLIESLDNYLKVYGTEGDKAKLSHYYSLLKRSQPSKALKRLEADNDIDAPYLKEYGVNMNEYVSKSKVNPLIGRKEELDRLNTILSMKKKHNALIVGDAGVGKTALVEGLCYSINNNTCHDKLKNKIVYSLAVNDLISGTMYRGDFEKRIKNILEDLEKNKDKLILFVDEFHTIIGTGATSSSSDASNVLKPYLARGDITVIGATTHDEYNKKIRAEKAFSRRFLNVSLEELSLEETREVVDGIIPEYEDFYDIEYSEASKDAIITLADRFIADRNFPDKALDILDACGAYATKKSSAEQIIVNKDMVAETVSKLISLDLVKYYFNKARLFTELDTSIKSIVFGQDSCVDAVVRSLKMYETGFNDRNKPIGAFLCVGPTGVGKTELALQIANKLGFNLLRLDMSEFKDEQAKSSLIGATAGYVGYEDGGRLTEPLLGHPNSVVLLDEIEKAHSNVFDLLLQVMDNGFIMNNRGFHVDCRNCLFLMTSNTGSDTYDKLTPGFVNQDEDIDVLESVNDLFSPEFKGRLTGILSFKPLDKETVYKVTNKFMEELKDIMSNKDLDLIFDEEFVKKFSDKYYDKKSGARSIKHAINQELKSKIIDMYINNSNIKSIDLSKKENSVLFVEQD